MPFGGFAPTARIRLAASAARGLAALRKYRIKKLQQAPCCSFLYILRITYYFYLLPLTSYLKIPSMESRLVELPVELMLLQRITSWMPFRATRPEMLESEWPAQPHQCLELR